MSEVPRCASWPFRPRTSCLTAPTPLCTPAQAVQGVAEARVTGVTLQGAGGSSDAGEALLKYTKEAGIDVSALGCLFGLH